MIALQHWINPVSTPPADGRFSSTVRRRQVSCRHVKYEHSSTLKGKNGKPGSSQTRCWYRSGTGGKCVACGVQLVALVCSVVTRLVLVCVSARAGGRAPGVFDFERLGELSCFVLSAFAVARRGGRVAGTADPRDQGVALE